MRLFSYCIPIDDGAAPNPFWKTCTLTICKPKIRKAAEVDDWVVGVGSVDVGGTNYSGRLVYAMKITEVLTLKEYDERCLKKLPGKIPDLSSKDYRRKVGDCLYHYSNGGVITQREGVHEDDQMEKDLGGLNALLSTHFYYFGTNAEKIPKQFSVLIRQGQSHQSIKNEPIKEQFVKWLEGKFKRNMIYGEPQIELLFSKNTNGKLCRSKQCRYRQNRRSSSLKVNTKTGC